MRERPTRLRIRLRLLALVLAAALGWYAVNPAPGPVRRVARDDEQPDEKRREARRPRLNGAQAADVANALRMTPRVLTSADEDADDLEWPEVIHVE